jgi:hypothetical protein
VRPRRDSPVLACGARRTAVLPRSPRSVASHAVRDGSSRRLLTGATRTYPMGSARRDAAEGRSCAGARSMVHDEALAGRIGGPRGTRLDGRLSILSAAGGAGLRGEPRRGSLRVV